MSKWTEHINKWKDCTECPLHEHRTKIVLARGRLPCDILFVGEAPGPSEDVLGEPFVGPAGKLLDRIIEVSQPIDLRIAFTNLVACIPKDEENSKFAEPPKESIRACMPRLAEFLRIAKPRVIIRVGTLAKKHVAKAMDMADCSAEVHDIIHPAALMRLDVSQKDLAIQQTQITVEDIFRELLPF